MFIDDIHNTYTYLNKAKSIVWEQSNDLVKARKEYMEQHNSGEMVAVVDPHLTDLLGRLMRERPTWRFKSEERLFPFTAANCLLRKFDIYDGDEVLGTVYMEKHWRDDSIRFFFNNPRLEKARQRHLHNYTTKPDVAAKRILKAFHLKTPKERAAEAFTAVRYAAQEVYNTTKWPLYKAKSALEVEMMKYFAANWNEVRGSLPTDLAKIDLPAILQAHTEAEDFMQALNGRSGVVVRVEPNDTYLVANAQGDTYEAYSLTDATLPENIRCRLGLLKMVEDGSYIVDVGLRVNAYTFFVVSKDGDL